MKSVLEAPLDPLREARGVANTCLSGLLLWALVGLSCAGFIALMVWATNLR
jgi:hypothetical protein